MISTKCIFYVVRSALTHLGALFSVFDSFSLKYDIVMFSLLIHQKLLGLTQIRGQISLNSVTICVDQVELLHLTIISEHHNMKIILIENKLLQFHKCTVWESTSRIGSTLEICMI